VRLIEDMNGPMVACEGTFECRDASKKLEFVMRMRKWKLCFVNPLREEIKIHDALALSLAAPHVWRTTSRLWSVDPQGCAAAPYLRRSSPQALRGRPKVLAVCRAVQRAVRALGAGSHSLQMDWVPWRAQQIWRAVTFGAQHLQMGWVHKRAYEHSRATVPLGPRCRGSSPRGGRDGAGRRSAEREHRPCLAPAHPAELGLALGPGCRALLHAAGSRHQRLARVHADGVPSGNLDVGDRGAVHVLDAGAPIAHGHVALQPGAQGAGDAHPQSARMHVLTTAPSPPHR